MFTICESTFLIHESWLINSCDIDYPKIHLWWGNDHDYAESCIMRIFIIALFVTYHLDDKFKDTKSTKPKLVTGLVMWVALSDKRSGL
jgi:hypothetical protein